MNKLKSVSGMGVDKVRQLLVNTGGFHTCTLRLSVSVNNSLARCAVYLNGVVMFTLAARKQAALYK